MAIAEGDFPPRSSDVDSVSHSSTVLRRQQNVVFPVYKQVGQPFEYLEEMIFCRAEGVILRNQPHRTQLAHLRSLLTPEMRFTLAHAIGVSDEDHTRSMEQILELIKEHLQQQQNIAVR
ncbi:hypothetical protein Hamer_G018032 [Homarus americanus]|uniref:Uncharacterized protein n=1 Tax=Homarus americanus TaxID=6706 RepID=A0A8J5KDN3_HOMAM|nr:hypothetical protein Hamer_G018032 [Homarus americanus]